MKDDITKGQLFKLPRLSLGKRNDYSVMFGGKFHGWLFVKNQEGEWAAVYKLGTIEDPCINPNAALLPPKSKPDRKLVKQESDITKYEE